MNLRGRQLIIVLLSAAIALTAFPAAAGETPDPAKFPIPENLQTVYVIAAAALTAAGTLLGIIFQNRNTTMSLQFQQIKEQQESLSKQREEITNVLQEQIKELREEMRKALEQEQRARAQMEVLEKELDAVKGNNRQLLEENLSLKQQVLDLRDRLSELKK